MQEDWQVVAGAAKITIAYKGPVRIPFEFSLLLNKHRIVRSFGRSGDVMVLGSCFGGRFLVFGFGI